MCLRAVSNWMALIALVSDEAMSHLMSTSFDPKATQISMTAGYMTQTISVSARLGAMPSRLTERISVLSLSSRQSQNSAQRIN
jgi:hypothetical protein